MNSLARLLQKKSADNRGAEARPPVRFLELICSSHVSLSGAGENHNFICVCFAPRSLRYLNITPSLGVQSPSGLRFHISLTCTAFILLTAHAPFFPEALAPGFLSELRGPSGHALHH